MVRENTSTMSLPEPISVDPCPVEIELRLAEVAVTPRTVPASRQAG